MWAGAICPLQVPFDKIFLVFTVIIIILTIIVITILTHHPHHLDHQPVRVNEEEGAAEAIDPLLETQPKPRRCWTEMSHRPSGSFVISVITKIIMMIVIKILKVIMIIMMMSQAKLHYLKIISELPSYGAKCFSTTLNSVSIIIK